MEELDLTKCEYFYTVEGMKLCKDNLSGSCLPTCNIYQILQEFQVLKEKNKNLTKKLVKAKQVIEGCLEYGYNIPYEVRKEIFGE